MGVHRTCNYSYRLRHTLSGTRRTAPLRFHRYGKNVCSAGDNILFSLWKAVHDPDTATSTALLIVVSGLDCLLRRRRRTCPPACFLARSYSTLTRNSCKCFFSRHAARLAVSAPSLSVFLRQFGALLRDEHIKEAHEISRSFRDVFTFLSRPQKNRDKLMPTF